MSKTHIYSILQMWPFCPSEPKINMDLVLAKTNQNITYESSVINNYLQKAENIFDLDFWP